MLIDALRHAVIQTLNQLLYISTDFTHTLLGLGLKQRQFTLDPESKVAKEKEKYIYIYICVDFSVCVCSHHDEKPARQLNSGDISETGTLADGHSVSGPGSGEVQPENIT